MLPADIYGAVRRVMALREGAIAQSRRIERLERLVANERWMGGERAMVGMDTDRAFRSRERAALQALDEEIHRLEALVAAGTEREPL